MTVLRTFLIFALMIGISSCNTTIYLVRHAEKADTTRDSPLSQKGEERAATLRDLLKSKGIDSIYTTAYQRTRQTAKPLAEALGISIITYKPDTIFSEQLKALKGKKVVVVGHSNTIPEIINYIAGEKVSIAEDDFDNLYIIRINRFSGMKITVESQTFGAPSP